MIQESINIVIIGDVDHGKSTLIGRLLLDTNSLSADKLKNLKKIAKELGKDTELAYFVDQLKEEREQEKTIDTTQIFFRIKNRRFVIIDTPGHVELLKNMITGAQQAQVGVLLIDAAEGIKEQTLRHVFLLSLLGIEKIIVVCNKMDLVGYKRTRFEELSAEIFTVLKERGYLAVNIIPISAKYGQGTRRRSKFMSWYKGLVLTDAMMHVKTKKFSSCPRLCFPVQDTYRLRDQNVAVGTVASGAMIVHSSVKVLPQNTLLKIKGIKVFGKPLQARARMGKSIGVVFEGRAILSRGSVVVDDSNECVVTRRFSARVFWLAKKPLEVNYKFIFRCAVQESGCLVESIAQRVDSASLLCLEKNSQFLAQHEIGTVTFYTDKPVVVEISGQGGVLERFVIEDNFVVYGAGLVREAQVLRKGD